MCFNHLSSYHSSIDWIVCEFVDWLSGLGGFVGFVVRLVAKISDKYNMKHTNKLNFLKFSINQLEL